MMTRSTLVATLLLILPRHVFAQPPMGGGLDGTNTFCNTSSDALTDLAATMGYPNTTIHHACLENRGDYDGPRCFYTYIPDCATTDSPLVFDIHGVSLCPHWNMETTGWFQLALENCFVLVWPTGNTDPDVAAFSCFALAGGFGPITPPAPQVKALDGEPPQGYFTGDCCCFGPTGPVDPGTTEDLTFLRNVASAVVDRVPQQTDNTVTIDTTRIYFGGHSNGCSAGLAMAAIHSDLVAAVCCHAPALITPFDDPSYNPVPIWIVHGQQDGTVRYDGWYPRGPEVPAYNPGANQVNNLLGEINGCTSVEEERLESDNATITTQTNCSNDAAVELLTIGSAGHTPFMDAELFQGDLEGAKVTTMDTTAMAWGFCSRQKRKVAPILVPVQQLEIEENKTVSEEQSTENGITSDPMTDLLPDATETVNGNGTSSATSGAMGVSGKLWLSHVLVPIVYLVYFF